MMAEFKAVDNFKEAEKLQKEVARRSKEKNKGVEAQVKELRDDIKSRVGKVSDLALLKKISALLPKSV
jgi:hypothetical protein